LSVLDYISWTGSLDKVYFGILITYHRKRYQLGEGFVPTALATSGLTPSEGDREDKGRSGDSLV